MTANAPLLVIHPLFGDQQNGSHGHQPAADHIEKGSADAAGGGQGRTFIVSYVNAYTRLYVIVYRCGYTCAIITGITISGGDFEPYRSSQAVMNCTPFVRQYDILSNKWGVLLCQKENQTSDIRQNSKNW